MSVIKTVQPFDNNGTFNVAPTPLTGADTLVYNAGKQQTLYLYNSTANAVTVTIDGDGGTTVSPPGLGGTVSVAGGYQVALPAGTMQGIALSTIRAYLQGVVNVTGGVAGVLAWIQQ